MKYLLDTNICIYIIKEKPKSVFDKFNSLKPLDIAISSITVAELKYGIYKSQKSQQNKVALAQFLLPLSIIDFNEKATDYYGKIRYSLEKQGQVIGGMDMLIAAHALSLDVILVTNNLKEFTRIPNLRLENWV
ncbi:MAG: type II toxin-antitoxin system VapC family toxin [Microcystaceae cyanobacterium]